MPQQSNVAKAELREIKWVGKQVRDLPTRVKVQFNPETMKVALSNKKAGGDQRGGSAIQYVGKGTTKLSLDLWFDVTVPQTDGVGNKIDDVREQVIGLMNAAATLEVPLKVDAGVGRNWDEAH